MDELELKETRQPAAAEEARDELEPPSDRKSVAPKLELDKIALWSLVGQNLVSGTSTLISITSLTIAPFQVNSWGTRTFQFVTFLYFTELYPGDLLPASLYGFITVAAAILFSSSAGVAVDTFSRLRLMRTLIVLQCAIAAAVYAIFIIMFIRYGAQQQAGKWGLFGLVTILSAALNVSNISISIAIERDWVTTVAQGDSEALTKLNTYLRRIDLLAELLAPLFVSMLATTVSYTFSAAFMLGYALVALLFEYWWINIVYKRWPILAEEEQERRQTRKRAQEEHRAVHNTFTTRQLFIHRASAARPDFRRLALDWIDFIKSGVFPSSLSISLLYFTVLSFDGLFITYLKAHRYSVRDMRAGQRPSTHTR